MARIFDPHRLAYPMRMRRLARNLYLYLCAPRDTKPGRRVSATERSWYLKRRYRGEWRWGNGMRLGVNQGTSFLISQQHRSTQSGVVRMGMTAALIGHPMQEICISQKVSQELCLRSHHGYRMRHGASGADTPRVREDDGGTAHY